MIQRSGWLKPKCWAAHIWCCPTSVVRIASPSVASAIDLDDGVRLRPCWPLLERLVERSVAPRIDPGHPVVVAGLLDFGNQQLQHFAGVADHGNVGSDILPDLGRIDVDVNDECVLGETADLASSPVVEARSDVDEQVALVEGIVDMLVTVHTHQPQTERVRLWKRAETKERECDRNAGLLHKRPE